MSIRPETIKFLEEITRKQVTDINLTNDLLDKTRYRQQKLTELIRSASNSESSASLKKISTKRKDSLWKGENICKSYI